MQEALKNSVNFIAKSNSRKLFILLFLFIYSISHAQTIGDFRSSVVAGEWTVASTWQVYNGTGWVAATTYPGQNPGSYSITILAGNVVNISSAISTNPMGTITINGTLSLNGDNGPQTLFYLNTPKIIVTQSLTPEATIYFSGKSTLVLPADAIIKVWKLIGLSGACNNNQDIKIGGISLANCNGAPGSIFTFEQLMAAGGTLDAVVSAPPVSCLGETVQLGGSYFGAKGTEPTYSWSSTGPVSLTFNPSSTAQNPTITPTVSGVYTISLTVTTVQNQLIYTNTEASTLFVLPTLSTTNAVICRGDSYVFNGSTYTTPGTYVAHLANVAGCDSVATLVLSEKLPTSSTTTVSICTADFPYVWNSNSYSTAGTYTKTFTNVAGCDSVATLILSEKLPTSSTTTVSICTADFPYSWNSNSYSTAGTYTKTFTNVAGCDSVATLILSEKLPTSSTTTVSICTADFPYVWNSSSYSIAGTYTKTFTNVAGCDSIATLVLSEKLPTSSTTTVSICTADFPYVWNSSSYAIAGTYTKTFTNVAGCDSVATLILSEKLPTSSTTTVSICTADFPYVWNSSSYSTSGTYAKTFTNVAGCDSIATLVLSEKLPTSSTTTVSICSADFPYVWNSSSYSTAGTYTKTFTNVAGCDSIATLVLSEKLPTSSTTTVSICTADFPYVWNSNSYTTAGTYTKTFTNVAGCDSVATLVLSEKLPTSSTTTVSICTADFPYVWNSSSYSTAGTYTKTFTNVAGCDSVATLVLSEKLPTSSTTTVSICTADFPYVWNSSSYSTAGTYTKIFTNVAGCDSVATLVLSEKLPTSSTTTVSICTADFPYVWNSSNYSTAGTYTEIFTNVAGCDSIATLVLSEKLPTSSTTTVSICSADFPYVWNSSSYSTSGTYTKTFTNVAGCDSVATLVLSEKLPTSSTTTVSICTADFPYVWNSSSYTTAGTYTKTFTNVAGCDSVATLVLSEKLPTSSTTTVSICTADFPYVWNSNSYSTAGTYTKTFINAVGCDSIATLVLSEKLPTSSTTTVSICTADFPYVWNSSSYSTAGTYTKTFTNEAGCDSVATLNLSVKYSTSSITMKTICSSELPYLWNGLIFDVAGRKSVTLQNSVSCDSIATLELTVHDATSSVTEITTCPLALPFIWNGTSYNSAGKYTFRSTNVKGCDSIATLILDVKTPLTSTVTEYVCSSLLPYSWNKKLYSKSGIYTTQLVSSSGCDSIATLVLNVVTPSSSTSREAVNSTELPYVWNKLSFTESGTYVSPYKYVNSMGCDSIAKLILRVNLSTSAETYASVCASDIPYIWNGTPYYNAGTFTKIMTNALGEDVTVTLHLTIVAPQTTTQSIRIFSGETYSINGHDYDKEGIYSDNLKNVNGCDSTVVTDLSFINIPNTITPNGDGHNDFFMAGWRTKIFNRNGILLYDGTEGWNGSYNNKPVSKDTYFYVLYYTSGTRTKSKEGYLMVIP